MRKVTIGIAVTALVLLLLASAFAFSATLASLRVNALSFVEPAEAAVIASPMTSLDEAQLASPLSETVRMEEFQQTDRVCQKDKIQDRAPDF
jgi:hypothetical protein